MASIKPDYVGGWTPGVATALLATVTNIKAAIGQLAFLSAYNPNGSVAYIQIFDAVAANVTLGTTAPKLVVPMAATSVAAPISLTAAALQFTNGISMAATTTATGSTAPGTGLVVSYGFM